MPTQMGKTARLLMIIAVMMSSAIVDKTEGLSLDVSEILRKGDSIKCPLTQDCDETKLPESTYDKYYKTDKSSWESLGLDPDLLHINEISVGFVPAFREKKNANSPAEINKKLFKPMAIVGDYISLSSAWDPDLKAIDWHVPIIKDLDGNPVWCLALMPSEGLDMITEKFARKIAHKLKEVNELGITTWIRFGHEMNGRWYAKWGMQPNKFKEKWHLLAKEIKSVTNRSYMVWSPNARFGDSVDDVRGGYSPYFPEVWSVDIVGISFYHWGNGPIRTNMKPTQEEAITKLYEFAKIYGPGGWNFPVIIAETAACYTTYPGTYQSVGGGASELSIKMTWLHLLLDRYIKQLIPGLKAVIWFEIDKIETAPETGEQREEDFRLILGNPEVSWAVHQLFDSYHSKELAERS
ncbi:hypothetical protein PCANC_08470 [Puccinia coronata f. sp. avenae]|uniref:GH26 domain-containing protein n=1 Tax=Puccinia coronata f. sp. avenae TaxID=200324 RepID=A0A2N5T4E5_9BASI|nr:hypothetical protein PCASD_13283 [Puccinia coronata f. sp. avenae]PLW20344.1 hypothetical protein PCANC_08470 [Puccinia coronata f. sp. avenae]PLW49166.1 hypothetical protein PCASD_02989 [Puccinia coronata f. sp. avenae]